MSKKRNLIFLSLLILGILLLTSCFLKPPVTEGILKGQVIVPEGSKQEKQLTGQALADATVNIIDPVTGDIIATTTTDANGYYQVFVPAGGPYLLQAVKNNVKVQQFTPQVEVGIEYDLGTADCSTTTVALIVQAMLDAEDFPNNPADINLSDIEADPNFNDVMSIVCSIIEAGGDPTESAVIQQAVEDFLSPPAPIPPAPTPSSAKEITSYKFEAAANTALTSDVIGTVDSGAHTVALTVPYGTDLTALVATFELSASATAKVGSTTQVSGTTANNFTSPVTYTVTAEDGSTQDWVMTVTVAIGPLDHFTITSYPDTTTAGVAFVSDVVVTAYDADDNVKTDYTGEVYFTSTDGSATLPYTLGSKYTFITGDNGTHTFSGTGFILKTAGSQTITLTDGTVSVTSSGITVSAGSKNKLLWVTQPPSSVSTGATWNTFTIEITDAYGNRTSDTDEVTITPSSLSLGGTTTKAASSGLTIFNDITCSTAGTITITGSATGLTSTPASDTITIALPVHNLTKNTYYNTIQAALTDADTGDIIEADDGTYTESITFPDGEVITLRSLNDASSTTITGVDGFATVTCGNSPDGTTLEGFTITHNSGDIGRGIIISAGYLTINNCTISNNTASNGGGIWNDGDLDITSSTISNNTASNGGGIWNAGTGTRLTITSSTIFNNSATNYGGGISNRGPSTLTITSSTISNNSAGYNGGGIYNDDGTLTITGSTISGNSANYGGGIHNYSIWGELHITGSTISNNSATNSGGGISNAGISSGRVYITGSTISNNSAVNGGGISNAGTGTRLTITGSTISNNSATNSGGGIYLWTETGVIIGGSSDIDLVHFNNFTDNKLGGTVSADQHIHNSSGECHINYPNNYFTPSP